MFRRPLPTVLLLAATAPAQQFPFLFTTSQTEQTLSGSGGTVLATLQPNEIALVEFTPCPVVSAEKWSPRTCFDTMAGDDDGNSTYWAPTMFGAVDAIVALLSPALPGNGSVTQRTVFWSPGASLGNGVSALPLRPGDTGRIVRNGTVDGQVEYFLRGEDVRIALGLAPLPVNIDVDAIAADAGYGVFFSLDQDTVVSTSCGTTLVRDGDVVMIPAWAITWTSDFRVAAVAPGQAEVVYTEAQMDAFVLSAQVADRFGLCQSQIQDLEALEIDYAGPVTTLVHCSGTPLIVPTLVFTGELLTGCSVLTTASGGQIHAAGCGPIGTSCGSGPTLGLAMGLQPPSALTGVPSHVNALAATPADRFVIEPKLHTFPKNNPCVIDFYSPGPITAFYLDIAPPGPNTAAASFPWLPVPFYPDRYVSVFSGWQAPAGFGTYTTSWNVPFAVKLVWQGVTLVNNQIVLSTPATIDVTP